MRDEGCGLRNEIWGDRVGNADLFGGQSQITARRWLLTARRWGLSLACLTPIMSSCSMWSVQAVVVATKFRSSMRASESSVPVALGHSMCLFRRVPSRVMLRRRFRVRLSHRDRRVAHRSGLHRQGHRFTTLNLPLRNRAGHRVGVASLPAVPTCPSWWPSSRCC